MRAMGHKHEKGDPNTRPEKYGSTDDVHCF
jgi:hypothetical protein